MNMDKWTVLLGLAGVYLLLKSKPKPGAMPPATEPPITTTPGSAVPGIELRYTII